jgi:hypothetical protein
LDFFQIFFDICFLYFLFFFHENPKIDNNSCVAQHPLNVFQLKKKHVWRWKDYCFFIYLLSFLIACSKKTVEGNKTHAIIYLIFFKLNKWTV